MEIKIRKQHFIMLPQKAIFWKEASTLLISDLHIGKITHFRKEGIAVPATAADDNFRRLDQLILTNEVKRIIFLGDLFHNRINAEWDLFSKWRSKFLSIDMTLVLGNHDIIPGREFRNAMIDVYENEFREDGFLFAHHPRSEFKSDEFVFCGHIHPVFCLRSRGRQSIKLPCFIFDESQAILPSFGVFTGGYEMEAGEGRRIFLVAKDVILPI